MIAVKDKKTELWGYINIKGEEIIPPKYTSAWSFWEGFAMVSQINNEGKEEFFFINKQGKNLFEDTWEDLRGFSKDGLAACRG